MESECPYLHYRCKIKGVDWEGGDNARQRWVRAGRRNYRN
jgi:hypothetical protein